MIRLFVFSWGLLMFALFATSTARGQTTDQGRLIEEIPLTGFDERPYDLFIPDGLTGPAPVLLLLHGGGGDAAGFRSYSCPDPRKGDFSHPNCFLRHAAENGYIAVFPRGTGQWHSPNKRSWNAGGAPSGDWLCMGGPACLNRVDDIAYFNALLDDLPNRAEIDRSRIYAAGMSAGGFMSHRLACDLADRIAGIAAVAGTNQAAAFPGCHPDRPVAVLQIHGTEECNIPYAGGAHTCPGIGALQNGAATMGVVASNEFWADANACQGAPRVTELPDRVADGTSVTRFDWDGCKAPLLHYRINGGGHQWIGGYVMDWPKFLGKGTRDIGMDEVWAFLSANRLQEASAAEPPSVNLLRRNLAMPGPYRSERLELLDLTDPDRDDRLVATRITRPIGEGPFPLVIMSHGNGGNWSSHQSIVDFVVSHGYVVLAPNHPASDTERVFRGRMDYASGTKTDRDPKAILGRPQDVTFLIDQAEIWNADPNNVLFGQIDISRIAVLGHSYGSYTVLAACGGRPRADRMQPPLEGYTDELAPDQGDPRVDVGVVYSTTGPNSNFFSAASFETIFCPVLNITGSKDGQLSGGLRGSEERYRGWQLMPEGDKYLAWLMNAGHNGWDDLTEASAVTRGVWRRNTPEADDVIYISNALTVAFLEAYLRDDDGARALLTQEYAQSLAGDVVDTVKWESK